jgi:TIR domain
MKPWCSKNAETKRLIEHLIIPYFPYWSFGEEIAVLKEDSGSPQIRHPGLISFAFETIAALLAHRLGRTDLLDKSRDDYVHPARRAGTRREEGDYYDVFLSYAQQDEQVAREIADTLEMNNFKVFDLNHEGTKDIQQQMEDALNRSRNMVVVLSDRPSRWQVQELKTFLRRSIDDERTRTIVPVFTSASAKTQSLPTVINSLRSLNLEEGREDALGQLVARLKAVQTDWSSWLSG